MFLKYKTYLALVIILSFADSWSILLFFLSPILGYLIGGFPTAYIISKLVAGIDPREFGSGSVSTRNTIRAAGLWPWGGIVFSVDITKGIFACTIIEYLLAPLTSLSAGYTEYYVILGAIAAVAGHCWMPYLKFQGGKGLGTYVGLLFYVYWPTIIVWPFLTLFLMIKTTGFAGYGSCWSTLYVPPFWYFVDLLTEALGLVDLPLAFWPHAFFTDGTMGWSFILLYGLGMHIVLTLRHLPEFQRIKRGEAQVWKSLKRTEMLK
ncbi:MAG: hypothetical protein GF308_19380 [Candidatus Heimdallarchaeota archaeon]|nr:hypothetical protein [Candidatus Heimdallarchaeota archaeon]